MDLPVNDACDIKFLHKCTMNNITIFLLSMTWVMATMLNAQAHLDSAQSSFEFVFMTDIHIRPDMNAPKGFQMAIDAVNQLNPDFVLTGGDLIFPDFDTFSRVIL